MARNYAQNVFQPTNMDKYVGNQLPFARSSWETSFMTFLDTHPSILNWGSECIRVPYLNPLTGRGSIYIPDFLIVYQHASGSKIGEVVEIKPLAQSMMREGKMKPHEQATVLKNQAKWLACNKWCKNQGLVFRVLTEEQLFRQGKKRR